MDCRTPSFSVPFTISRSLLKLMSIESVMPSNHLFLCHPLLLPLSIFPSIRVFSHELVLCIRWPKYWSFRFSISTSSEISLWSRGLSRVFSSTTIQKHQFFSTHSSSWSNSHPYMTTRKIIALTRQLFVSNVMSLLFNTLSRFVIALLFSCKEQKHTPFKSRRTDHHLQ